MKIGPKYKIAKRLGPSVFEKTQTQKFAIAAERGMGGRPRKRGRGPTEFGRQLLEKQKVRFTYGLTERKFSSYVREAMQVNAREMNPAEALHRELETRLDNIVYRMGIAPTRQASRQLVSHGHITVDGRRTTVPSRQVRIGEVIGIREGSKTRGPFENLAERLAERPMPSWLTFDAKSMTGGITQQPTTESADAAGDLSAVLSFYSR